MGEEVEITYKKNRLNLVGFIVFCTIGILGLLVWALATEHNETVPKYTYEIPEWVKANAGWWSEGQISDEEFSFSFQWLIDHGIIKTEICTGRCL